MAIGDLVSEDPASLPWWEREGLPVPPQWSTDHPGHPGHVEDPAETRWRRRRLERPRRAFEPEDFGL